MYVKKSQQVLFYLCLIFFVVVIFGAISFHYLKFGDFPQHIGWAKELSENGYMYKIPHTLFHRLVVIVRAMLPANLLVWMSVFAKQVYDLKSFEISTIIVMVLSHLATALILLKYLIKEWEQSQSRKLIWWAGVGAFVLMLVTPVFVFTLPQMFRGYAAGNRFDNPTYIVLKPFVLLMFLSIKGNLVAKWSWKSSLWMTGFVLCATLTKPNFTISIIPAIGISLVLFYLNDWKRINWLYLLFPLGLTAVIVLAGQYAINFIGNRGDRMLIAPFESLLSVVKDIPTIFLYLLVSLLFPFSVFIFYWKEAKQDLSMRLAGVNFLVSLTYGFLLAEKINLGSNNFWNSVQIATFLLFSVCVVYLGKRIIEKKNEKMKMNWNEKVPVFLLVLHFGCGIVYYILSLMTNGVLI